MADDNELKSSQGSSQGNEIPEKHVFRKNYHDLVALLPNANLSHYFVSSSIITIADDHNICSSNDTHHKAVTLLKPIAAALETGYSPSFYKMLEIMKEYGNEPVKALADRISQSDELTMTELGSQDVTTSTTTIPSQITLQETLPSTECFSTPDKASEEFDVVFARILQELNANIQPNDKAFKSACYYFTHRIFNLVLSQEDKDKVSSSTSFTDVKNVMDSHWNWSSHRLLYMIIKKLKSDKSLKMLKTFDKEIDTQMKLETVHKNLQSKTTQSSDYCKMIAVLNCQKDYSEVTLEEGSDIDEFVFEYLGTIGAPLSKVYQSTLETTNTYIEMEWNVSAAAVDALCTDATRHKDEFLKKSFLFLKIGNFTVISHLPCEVANPHVPPASLKMVFNDPIHGHIELDPVLLKIIDTPQFQRLRYIKQLGGGYYVFPGASHNRFEHSIGVCYLAGELVQTLRIKQPELGITDDDVLCVKIAGLCNNLGCGPFSHMFETTFIPKARKGHKNWKHQEASVKMFDYLINENGLSEVFKTKDLTFVKELILCPKEKNWAETGRSKDKEFLYEIVTNKRNGIDVKKWDYLARDCYHLGITNIFDYRRFVMFARVIECDGRKQICTRDKEVINLYDMFYTRYLLHKRAYYHKTVTVIELMICEAFLKADSHILKLYKQKVKLSECIDESNMQHYTHLTDHVFHQILLSTDKQLQKSKDILNNIVKRQLYKYIGRTQPKSEIDYTEEKIAKEIAEYTSGRLSRFDLAVKIVTFDYGVEVENPIDHVRFYAKDRPNQAFKLRKDQVSRVMLLKDFVEQEIRVYCKKKDENSLQAAQRGFTKWCGKTGYTASPDSEFDYIYTPYGTPLKTAQEDPDDSNREAPNPKRQRLNLNTAS